SKSERKLRGQQVTSGTPDKNLQSLNFTDREYSIRRPSDHNMLAIPSLMPCPSRSNSASAKSSLLTSFRDSLLWSILRFSEVICEETSLEEKFDAAVKVIRNLPKDGPYQPSSDMQLRFYGLFKQATEGPCNKPQPSFWQVVNRAKWDAWKGMSSMSKEDAMLQYVEELKKVVETMPLTEDVSDFVSVASPLMDIIEDASREDDGSVSDDTSDTKGESKGDSPQMRASMLEDPYTYDSGSDTEDFHDTQTATQVPRLEIYQDRQVPGPRSNTHSKTGEELKNRLQDILMQLEANAQHLERIERLIKQRAEKELVAFLWILFLQCGILHLVALNCAHSLPSCSFQEALAEMTPPILAVCHCGSSLIYAFGTFSEDNGSETGRRRDMGAKQLLFHFLGGLVSSGIIYCLGRFHFSPAWILASLGFGALLRYNKQQRHKRLDFSQMLATTDEKELIVTCLKELPSWVLFPDVERAEWLNTMIIRMWPFIGHYVKDMIETSIQPQVQETLKAYKLPGFRFTKTILGNVPPRIGGVKSFKQMLSRDEIVFDLEVIYAGDCKFECMVRGVTIGVNDLKLRGFMRVVLKPLVKTHPIIGGIQAYFLNPPELDFDLTNFANVLDFPGFSDLVRTTVMQQICSFIVIPNKFSMSMAPDVPLVSLKLPLPRGVLRIHLVEAKNLVKKDIGILGMGKSDPYAVISVGAHQFKTKVISNTVNPFWDYVCEADVESVDGQKVQLQLWDFDPGFPGSQNDDALGRIQMDIADIAERGHLDTWVRVQEAKTGQVHLVLDWLELSEDPHDLAEPLDGRALSNHPDPKVILSVGTQKEMSAVSLRTCSPVWEECFMFFIKGLESQNFVLKIEDAKSAKQLGNVTIQLPLLLKEEHLQLFQQKFHLSNALPDSAVTLTLRLSLLKHGKMTSREATKIKTEEERKPGPLEFGYQDSQFLKPEAIAIGGTRVHMPEDQAKKKKSIRGYTWHKDQEQVQSRSTPCSPGEWLTQRTKKRLRVIHEHNVAGISNDTSIPSLPPPSPTMPKVEVMGIPEPLKPSDTQPVSIPPPSPNLSHRASTPGNLRGSHKYRGPPSLDEMVSSTVLPATHAIDLDNRSMTEVLRRKQGEEEGDFHLGRIQVSVRYASHKNKLVVVIHRCSNLPMEDEVEKPDPYVKLYLLPDRSSKLKTGHQKDEQFPIYDETFEYPLSAAEVKHRTLELQVISKKGKMAKLFGKMPILGMLRIPLSNVAEGEEGKIVAHWFDLEPPQADYDKDK
ncbi:unnamed protein product, partial [Darwinula stevensoni]